MRHRDLPADAVALMLQQLSALLRTGSSPEAAVALLRRSSSGAKRCPALIDSLAEACEGRARWRAALSPFGRQFPVETGELLDAAQERGQLPGALDMVAQEFGEIAGHRRRLRAVMAWPMVVVGLAIVILTVLMVFVVPAFKEVFSSFGADLPWLTLMVLNLSEAVVAWWWVSPLVAVALVLALRSQRVAAAQQRWRAAMVMRTPVLGQYVAIAFLHRCGRLVHAARAGGVDLPVVAAYLRASEARSVLSGPSQALESALLAGRPLAEALRDSLPLGGDLALAIETDALTGGGTAVTERALDMLADESGRQSHRLEQWMNLVTYIVVGFVVGGVVIAMYLPIFKLGAVV